MKASHADVASLIPKWIRLLFFEKGSDPDTINGPSIVI